MECNTRKDEKTSGKSISRNQMTQCDDKVAQHASVKTASSIGAKYCLECDPPRTSSGALRVNLFMIVDD